METHLQDRETAQNQGNLQAQQQQQERATTGAVAGAAATTHSSPIISASSSPSHEFSFTISLPSSATTTTGKASATSTAATNKTKYQQHHQQPPLAIDLSPADDIFFHGHLLPLHFLSHLHASSPRPSTHSLDSFSIPTKKDNTPQKGKTTSFTDENKNIISCSCSEDDHCISFNKENYDDNTIEINLHNCEAKESKSNKSSFSLFGLSKRKKGSEKSEGITTENNVNRRKLKFDVSQFLKRYINMVKPLLSHNRGRRDQNGRGGRQSYSFSGTVTPRDNNREMMMRGKRGEYWAPASMRTSPTNSGLLLATAGVPSPVSDSTMEELQAAIQAAIAHCKNSISAQDKSQSIIPVN